MASVELKLYVDLTNRQLVRGLRDTTPFTLPAFYQEDDVRMNLAIMKVIPDAGPYDPYEKLAHSGLSVVCKVATTAPVILAAGTSTYNSSTNTLDLTLDLNTGAMVTAMSGQTSITPFIEFELDDGDGNITAYQAQITVKKEYITGASASPDPLDTYLTANQSDGRFVRKVVPAGEGITFTSPDGTKQFFLYIADDGSIHADQIS